MIPAALLGTGRVLPGRRVENDEVSQRAVPPLDPDFIWKRAGIRARHWVEPGTRAAPLAAEAIQQALSQAGLAASDLRRLIFVSSSSGDWLGPGTASLVAAELGLTGQCDAFDINNACVGFLTALDLAARSVATGLGPVAIVAAEFFSDMITPDDPRTYAIFGDAIGALVVGPAVRDDEGVLGVTLHTDPTPGLTTYIPHPRFSGHHEGLRFGVSNQTIARGAIEYLVRATRTALEAAHLHLDQIDCVLPHQPNGRMFDIILSALKIDPARTHKVVDQIGSCGAASIPFSLDCMARAGRIPAGASLLMLSIGAGASYGAMVLRVGGGL